MSQELIYTSAQRGLKPGSQGFCTVVCTQGMSPGLQQRLESLSGYRHVFPPQDPNARLNPVLCSHLVLNVAGQQCHVLSRICDAGLDHTQRTNKFAHHVVLNPRELPPGGPAWLLAAPSFMQATWDGVPKVVPAGRQPPAGNVQAAICRAWQQATGDAGWGGALAETALGNRAAVIVFRPGTDLLPLLAESLALLPPEQRWNVKFSTFFNKLPPGVDCQWRCVVEGSPEAISARSPGALIIDLCKPLGAAAASPLVQVAQTGVIPVARTATAAPGAYQANDAELAQLLGGAEPRSSPGLSVVPRGAEASADELYDVAIPPAPLAQDAMYLPPGLPKFKRKPKSRWPLIAALTATCGILIAAIIGFSMASNSATREIVKAPRASSDESKPTGDSTKLDGSSASTGNVTTATRGNGVGAAESNGASDSSHPPPKQEPSATTSDAAKPTEQENHHPENSRSTAKAAPSGSTPAQPPTAPPPAEAKNAPPANSTASQEPVHTPPSTASKERQQAGDSGAKKTDPVRYGKWVTLPETIGKSTVGGASGTAAGPRPLIGNDWSNVTEIAFVDLKGEHSRKACFSLRKGTGSWICSKPVGLLGDQEVAKFSARNSGLFFDWLPENEGMKTAKPADKNSLSDHFILTTKKSGEKQIVALRKPENCNPLSLPAGEGPSSSKPLPQTRIGISTELENYSLEKIQITRVSGESAQAEGQVIPSAGASQIYAFETPPIACFSVAIEPEPKNGSNVPDLKVVMSYRGVLLSDGREAWRKVIPSISDTGPVPINGPGIIGLLSQIGKDETALPNEEIARDNATGKEKEDRTKKVTEMKNRIAIKDSAQKLKSALSSLVGASLHFQVCTTIEGQKIVLFTTDRE